MEFSQFLHIALAGVVGTVAMVLVMGLIHGLGLAEADMVRAIGSVYTKSLKNSLPIGLMIHFTAGIFFAFMYALLISIAPIPVTSPWTVFRVCLLAGIFHGFVVSMLLAVVVAEYHPIERFQNAGVAVVLSHLVGHVFYGAGVGLVFVLTNLKLSIL